MMNHIPSSVMMFKDMCHMERNGGVTSDKSFHGHPSYVFHNSSPDLTDLEVDSLLPAKRYLPTLYYCIISAYPHHTPQFNKGLLQFPHYTH